MYELGQLQVPVINLDDDQIADELADLEAVKPAIEHLRTQGIYIHSNLVNAVLRDVGE